MAERRIHRERGSRDPEALLVLAVRGPACLVAATLVAAAVAGLAAPAHVRAQEPDSLPRPHGDSIAVADSLPVAEPESIAVVAPDAILLLPGLSAAARAELERQLGSDPVVFQGATAIPRDSVFTRSVLVIGGDLTFAGRTPGTVLVAGGDLFVRPGAEIGGDVVVVGGGFYGSGMARIAGEKRVVEGGRVRVIGEPERVAIVQEPEPRPFPIALQGIYGFLPQMYNRVDGLAVRWGVGYVPPEKRRDAWRLSAEAILRTSRDDVGWRAAVEKELPTRRLILRGAVYDLTDTAERWHRGDVETSLSTFFLGEDNRFYFDRRGLELRALKELKGPLVLDLALRADRYRSVLTQDPFTVAEDDFLPNPPVPEGTMRSALAGLTWEGRDDPEAPLRGSWARLEAEAAGGLLGGEFSFTAARLDLRRYQPVAAHRLAARIVLAGRLGGSLPEQRRHHLGGAATLPGYEALSVRGDRAALLNLRYRIPIPSLSRFRLFKQGGWLVLLGDLGDAWESGADPEWLASGGIGVAGRGPLGELGVYVVVPSERIADDQAEVAAFLYFGSFF